MFENGSFLRRRKRYKRPNSDLIKEANKYANLHLYHQAAAMYLQQRKSQHDQITNHHLQQQAIVCQSPNALLNPYLTLPLATGLPPLVSALPNQMENSSINNGNNKSFPINLTDHLPITLTNSSNLLDDRLSTTSSTFKPDNLTINNNLSNGLSNGLMANQSDKIETTNLVTRTIETLNELQKQTSNLVQSTSVLDTQSNTRLPLINSSSLLANCLSNQNITTSNFNFTTNNNPSTNSINKIPMQTNKNLMSQAINSNSIQKIVMNNELVLNDQINNQINNHLNGHSNNQVRDQSISKLNQPIDQKELNENLSDKNRTNLNDLLNYQTETTLVNYSSIATNYSTSINQSKNLLPIDLENILNNVQQSSNCVQSLPNQSVANNNVQLLLNNHSFLNSNLNLNNLNSKLSNHLSIDKSNSQQKQSSSPLTTIKTSKHTSLSPITNLTSNSNSNLISQDSKYILYRPF